LLFNVVKHAGVREASLRLRRWGGYVCLSVSDRGRGFDIQEFDKSGGLGLLRVREQIKFLGGRLKVRSTKGKGSLFILAVPNSPPQATEATGRGLEEAVVDSVPPQERETGSGDHALRVLLADDHKIVRQGIESLLIDGSDIEIVGQAGNGREAVDLACRLEPDVVVMDVSMPVMSGEEATRQIKRHLPQTRVIALSMHDEVQVTDRMRSAGATAYLLKTTPSEELLAAIRGPKADGGQ
jgi:CheY-like chemotaxis protein